MTYTAPTFKGESFTCPHCGVFAQFGWSQAHHEVSFKGISSVKIPSEIYVANCTHCKQRMVWLFQDGAIPVYPNTATGPLPHTDMPEDIKKDYLEARDIADRSPRGAAALLRLVVQKLCVHLGESGANINQDIASLVQNGLPRRIQQALDVVRVTGNNAVHPGEIDLDDNPEMVIGLFGLINLIVDNRISEPKKIEEMYAALPPSTLHAIQRRDG